MLEKNTFGATPAAHYLVRLLNESENKRASKACTIRINMFNKNTSDIVKSVNRGAMEAKTAANLLRLLREDAALIDLSHMAPDSLEIHNEFTFMNDLLRNTIIGHIKSAIRKVSTIRKIESNTPTAAKIMARGKLVEPQSSNSLCFKVAGYNVAEIKIENNVISYKKTIPSIELISDPKTPELLYARSLKRCKRQGKQWAQGE